MRKLIAATALVLIAGAARAEDAVEIKPGYKTGLKLTREQTMSASLSDDHIRRTSKIQAQSRASEEILDAKDGRALRVRRLYDLLEGNGLFPGQSALRGFIVSVERKDGAVVRKAAETAPAEALEKECVGDEFDLALASGKPVPVGGSWTCDAALVKAWWATVDTESTLDDATATCKLIEITDREGKRCARILMDFKGKGKIHDEKGEIGTVGLDLHGDVFFSLDDGLSIESHVHGSVSKSDGTEPGEKSEPTKFAIVLVVDTTVGKADFTGGTAPPGDK